MLHSFTCQTVSHLVRPKAEKKKKSVCVSISTNSSWKHSWNWTNIYHFSKVLQECVKTIFTQIRNQSNQKHWTNYPILKSLSTERINQPRNSTMVFYFISNIVSPPFKIFMGAEKYESKYTVILSSNNRAQIRLPFHTKLICCFQIFRWRSHQMGLARRCLVSCGQGVIGARVSTIATSK